MLSGWRARIFSVEWEQPHWANFAVVELFEQHPLGGLRRVWPERLEAETSALSPAVLPSRLLAPGKRLRVEVVAGRADVRAENGEIWALAGVGHEVGAAPAGPTPPGPTAAPAPSPERARRP